MFRRKICVNSFMFENGERYCHVVNKENGDPVNVAIKGKNYLLEFRFNKKMQPVYTLMDQ